MNAPHKSLQFATEVGPHQSDLGARQIDLGARHRQAGAAETVTMRDLSRFARRSWKFVLLWTLMFVAAAAAYALTATPSYTARATLIIDPNKARSLLQDTARQEFVVDPALIDSQVEVLRSDRIAGNVVTALDLTKDEEFVPKDEWSPVAALKSALGLTPAPAIATGVSPETREAIRELGRRLGVARVGTSYVLDVSFTSRDPVKSAVIANAVVAAYIDEELAASADAARRGAEWLQGRLEEMRGQVREAARETLRFKSLGGGAAAAAGVSAGDAQVQLAELESVSQTYRKLYETMLQKFTETLQKQSYPVADARLIATASTPIDASQPKSKLIVGFAAAFGLLSGAGVMALRTSFDRRLRDPAQIRALDVAYLGAVGRRKVKTGQPPFALGAAPADAEDLRGVRASIVALLPGQRARMIGVMGLSRGAGGVAVAFGLGPVFALAGGRTLLVDADIADPALTRACDLELHEGLLQSAGERSLVELAVPVAPELWVAPVGQQSSAATPADVLSGERGRFRLDELRRHFETTLVDLPPLTCSTDARLIGAMLDGVVLVVEERASDLDEISAVADALRRDGATVLGVVLNKVDLRRRPAWASS